MKMRCIVVFLSLLLGLSAGQLYAQNLDINDQTGKVNDTVSFTISINNAPNAVDAMQFDVSYDTSVLDFTDNFTKGSLVNSFSQFDVKERSSGQIRVAGFTTTSLKAGTSGDVVKLEFTVKNCASATLTLINLEDALSGWSTGSGRFTCAVSTPTPTPTPTPTASPVVTATPAATPTATASPTPTVAPGETGALTQNNQTPDINDLVTITVVDGNLNTNSSAKESVAAASSLWGGTTTNNRGDRLTVKKYDTATRQISVSHPDGSAVGTQTVRVSSADNTYVWMVPTSLTGTFRSPLSFGSTTFRLGTQSVSSVPLVRGTSSGADSFLSSASTSSFTATLDGLDNTVEISPDGTHWIAVPMVEAGVNSSTFVGTIGFDGTAARITTSTTMAASTVFSDFTGTSTITFQSAEGGHGSLTSVVGTGSVVRISDGVYSETKEVTGVANTVLTVEKLSNSGFYNPWKTWVQVIGNDFEKNRLDTVSGASVFRIGGFYGATYRIRYNDGYGASSAYMAGDTLAITTSNIAFKTNTGNLSVSPSGTVGLNSQIEVTLVDDDLNISTTSVETTYKDTASITNLNELGLGNPKETSTGNRSFKNGSAAKQILVSRAASVTSAAFASSDNTVSVQLTETAANSGTFKGTFKLTAGNSEVTTSNAATPPVLKVSNGDAITVFYNDSPSKTAENNLSAYTTTSMTVMAGLGVLSLSKSEAFLNGDSVVITLEDHDKNTTIGLDSATVSYEASSETTSNSMTLAETAGNSATFIGTLRTSRITSSTSTPPTIRAVANGVVTITYQDDSRAAGVTTSFSTKNFGAMLAFISSTLSLGNNAVVSLYDPETNASISQLNTVDINIKSTTDSSGITLRLTETANDSGSFLGTITVSSDSSLANTRIKASVGDTLTATFTDNPDANGNVSSVTATASVVAATTPFPTATATPTAISSPIISPTVCEADWIWVSPSKLTLKRKKSGEVSVTVTGEDACAVEGETVTATINAAGKQCISTSPTAASTDADGQATFTIIAKKEIGNARVTFRAGGVKKSMTVKVKK